MRKILCPVDYSDAAINAIEYAGYMAQKANASLSLLNVEHIEPLTSIASQVGLPNKIGRIQQTDFDRLERYCQEVRDKFNIPCDYEVEIDTSSLEKIVAWLAEVERFDLIVMGTNGTDTLYQYFFGSNSYHTILESHCPLLVVPEECKFEALSSIIVAIDYREPENDLVDQIVYFASLFGAKIILLHISKKEKYEDQLMYRKYKDLIEKNGYEGLVEYESLIRDDLLKSIGNHLQDNEPSLLTLTTPHRNIIEQLFHTSVTKQIVETTDYPVLVVH